MDHKLYTEKALELANDHPLAFGAWLILEAVQGKVIALQDKTSARLEESDREALTHG
jgi:hypothetical protein